MGKNAGANSKEILQKSYLPKLALFSEYITPQQFQMKVHALQCSERSPFKAIIKS